MLHYDAVPEMWTKVEDLRLTLKDLAPGQSCFLLSRHETGKYDRLTARKICDDAVSELLLQGYDVVDQQEYTGQQEKKTCWNWLIEVRRPDPFGA